MKIILSKLSLSDLTDIKNYIKKDSIHYAKIFINKIIKSIKILKSHPDIGRIVPEFNIQTIREIIVKNYRIIYRIDKSAIFIVSIIHGSRLLKKAINNPWIVE